MKKILLVSAAAPFLERNQNLLKRREFHIFAATTGMEALRILREELCDLVISELQLVDMGGDRLCSMIRTEGQLRQTAVVLICRSAPADLARAEQSGASAVLSRPLQPEQLIKAVERVLSTHLIRSPRAQLAVPVLTRVGDREFSCVSHNISVTGILVESESQLAVRERIVHQFVLPGQRYVMVEGEVVRTVQMPTGRHQYGVQFIELADEYRHGIDSYIASVIGGNC
jgi:CheY-like chemotaxis protein